MGVLSRWRRHGPYERTLIAAAVAVGTYMLVHGSLDWLDEYPALKRWYDEIAARPAVQRGLAVLSEAREQKQITEAEREVMFGKTQFAAR